MVGTKKFSFGKKARLRDPKVYRSLFKSGRGMRTKQFSIRWRENEQAFARLGMVLSKKKSQGPSIAIP